MWVVVTLDFIETVKKAVGDGRRLRFGWSHGLGERLWRFIIDDFFHLTCLSDSKVVETRVRGDGDWCWNWWKRDLLRWAKDLLHDLEVEAGHEGFREGFGDSRR
ncbi:hypothetical protein AAZX31_16G074700 [Glycine max]|uniref:Uncharacterized protein n=1 Tax=Glycine max TaxID=3847 RepID=A0A0R0FMT9_SOYBN|nr:hypothetical protein JHK82_044363 [Glycine max]KAG5107914.1 hypothetical protein JHK84_044821 [Glycine max]KAH1150481.1 hypothetical protein GYH30_044475 [Glycine max]KRH07306.1 hypothetical protein GLYMA_16G080600v4 [Glycine max]